MNNRYFFLAFFCLFGVCDLMAQMPVRRVVCIEEMFALAQENSHSIRSFVLAEKEAEHGVRVAKNAMLPQIDASVSVNYYGDGLLWDRNFTNSHTAPIPSFGNNFALEASQVIYAGGSISNAVAMSKLMVQLAEEDTKNHQQDIRFLLVGNYLELYKLCNQERVYLQNIEQTKRLLEDINQRQMQGLALRNDITRYELQLKNLELALSESRNSQTIINHQLVTIMGIDKNTVVEVDTTILDALPLVAKEDEWQNEALKNSSVLKYSKLGVDMAKRNERLVRSAALPSVGVFAADRLDGPIIIEVPPLNKNLNYWYVGVGVKYDVSSIFKNGKKMDKAKVATLRANQGYQAMVDDVQIGVKDAYVRFVESFTVFQTREKSLELAEQNYDVIHNRYLNDLALITDMLDASNAKLSAQLQVANARVNIIFNFYRLKKAIGNI